MAASDTKIFVPYNLFSFFNGVSQGKEITYLQNISSMGWCDRTL